MNWKRATLYTLLVLGASSLAYSLYTAIAVSQGLSITGSLPGWLVYGGIGTRILAVFLAFAAIGRMEKNGPFLYAAVAFVVATLVTELTPLLAGQPLGDWIFAQITWGTIAALGVFAGSRLSLSRQSESEAVA